MFSREEVSLVTPGGLSLNIAVDCSSPPPQDVINPNYNKEYPNFNLFVDTALSVFQCVKVSNWDILNITPGDLQSSPPV